MFSPFEKILGLELEGIHFHDLRHTGNQHTANAGANLRALDGQEGPRERTCRADLPAFIR
jgi:integrase